MTYYVSGGTLHTHSRCVEYARFLHDTFCFILVSYI